MVATRIFAQMDWCPKKHTCNECAIVVPRPDDILADLSLEEILLKSFTWKKQHQRSLLSTFHIQKNKIICMHCLSEVKMEKNRRADCFLLRHLCTTNDARTKRGEKPPLNSNLFTVHEWCPDKINCKSCIQIVVRNNDTENDACQLSPAERHREVMHNFNFDIRKIICVHCGTEQTRANAGPTIFNSHVCLKSNESVRGRLFHKIQ